MELHLGLIQRIIFFLLKFSYQIQSIISEIFWFTSKSFVYISWRLWGTEDNELRQVNFREEICRQRVYYDFILIPIFAINRALNGLRDSYDSYRFLLKWNPAIPIIALKNVKNNYVLSRLGNEHEDEPGIFPLKKLGFLGTSKKHGYFKIIQKEKSDNDYIRIECVWLSGADRGQVFVIDRFYFGEMGNNNTQPDSIYFPPNILVILFEIIISIGALITLIGAMYQLWQYIVSTEFYNNIMI